MCGPQARRPRETGHETVAHGRGARHPARPGARPGEPPRLPLLAPTLDKLDDIGPLPDDITVHLDAGYDSQKTRDELADRDLTGEIAHKGDKAPIQAGQRWHVERPTPGTTASTGSSAATSERGSHRRVLRHRRHDHYRPQAHTRVLEPACRWDGRPETSMITHLSARSLALAFHGEVGGWARLNGKVLLNWDDKGCSRSLLAQVEEHFLQ